MGSVWAPINGCVPCVIHSSFARECLLRHSKRSRANKELFRFFFPLPIPLLSRSFCSRPTHVSRKQKKLEQEHLLCRLYKKGSFWGSHKTLQAYQVWLCRGRAVVWPGFFFQGPASDYTYSEKQWEESKYLLITLLLGRYSGVAILPRSKIYKLNKTYL